MVSVWYHHDHVYVYLNNFGTKWQSFAKTYMKPTFAAFSFLPQATPTWQLSKLLKVPLLMY